MASRVCSVGDDTQGATASGTAQGGARDARIKAHLAGVLGVSSVDSRSR